MNRRKVRMRKSLKDRMRVIISGGGTGGHIFPAISIANAIKEIDPDAAILFVGAEGKMEMRVVPEAGYQIVGLPIAGFNRKQLWKNFKVIYLLIRSQLKARRIIKNFKPHVAVGVGGYASGPTLKVAGGMNIPTLIQEQNSYAGVTNKLLAKGAKKICVAYEGMEKFFPEDKIVLTGNPVRQGLLDQSLTRDEAVKHFGFDPKKKTILIVGGSLGAGSINHALQHNIQMIKDHPEVQFIWQTGKLYFDKIAKRLEKESKIENLNVMTFIKDMNMAYTAADLVVSRAGASSISEFCLLHKAVILVPSPNVAEDHQTKNAMVLVNKGAAIYINDKEVDEKLLPTAIQTVMDDKKLQELKANIAKLELPDSARIIAEEVIKLTEK